MITVKELIEQLQKMPQDEAVYCIREGYVKDYFDEVIGVYYEQPDLNNGVDLPKMVVIHFGG